MAEENKDLEFVVKSCSRPIRPNGNVSYDTTVIASDITNATPRYSTYEEAKQVADSRNADARPYAGHLREYFVAQVEKKE